MKTPTRRPVAPTFQAAPANAPRIERRARLTALRLAALARSMPERPPREQALVVETLGISGTLTARFLSEWAGALALDVHFRDVRFETRRDGTAHVAGIEATSAVA